MPQPQPYVLLVTRDPALIECVAGVAASAAMACAVRGTVPGAAEWSAAPVLLVGADLVDECLAEQVPRRGGVVLLAPHRDDPLTLHAAGELGGVRVLVLPADESALGQVFATASHGRAPGGTVVAVIGGRGGAGATTLACALAVTAGRARVPTMLVDADPLGGGIDLTMGCEQVAGARWDQVQRAEGRLPGDALIAALPLAGRVPVLSHARTAGPRQVSPAAMRMVLDSAAGSRDLVVVDLPRALDEVTAVVLRAGRALVVVPAEVRAAAAAAHLVDRLRDLVDDLAVVVRGPSPAGLPAELVAQALRLPLSGELRAEPRLSDAIERGDPPARSGRGPLAGYCTRVLATLVPARVA